MDLRGMPSAVCGNCGSDQFKVVVVFDPETYEVAGYGLEEAECYGCGSFITPPTPLDIIN